MKAYPIIRESVRSSILDFSFPLVAILLLIVNIVIGVENKIFTETPTPYPFWLIFFFDSFIFMIYGGYLGTKYFAREFDKNTMISLVVTPAGRNGVYVGKLVGGLIVIGTLSLIVFFQILAFLGVWGDIAYLLWYWYGMHTLVLFISSLYIMLLAIAIGVLVKKTGATLLVSSFYVILSLFILAFMPMRYAVDDRVYYSIFFPNLGIWYLKLSISSYAIVYSFPILLGAIGALFIALISFFLFKGVRL